MDKVFKFYTDEYFYTVSGKTEQEAMGCLNDFVGGLNITTTVEVPETQWDDKNIKIREDNDPEKDPFFVSIRDLIIDGMPEVLSSNDPDFFE